MIGSLLAGLAALAFIAIGLGALAAPRFSAAQYGFPAGDPPSAALVRALGARDLALGAILAAVLAGGAGTPSRGRSRYRRWWARPTSSSCARPAPAVHAAA